MSKSNKNRLPHSGAAYFLFYLKDPYSETTSKGISTDTSL